MGKGGRISKKGSSRELVDSLYGQKGGGMGVRNLSTLKKPLLRKWCWRCTTENETLWKQVI